MTSVPNLESPVGTYNDTVLEKLDHILAKLATFGMKAIISPHDAGTLAGANGCDAYCSKYGSSDTFYSSASAKADYDARLAHILNFVSPSSGKQWADWWEAIAAFDI